jgi:hypothetical protein
LQLPACFQAGGRPQFRTFQIHSSSSHQSHCCLLAKPSKSEEITFAQPHKTPGKLTLLTYTHQPANNSTSTHTSSPYLSEQKIKSIATYRVTAYNLLPSRSTEKKAISMTGKTPIIELDGRTGEGGGQRVRIACALAAVATHPVRITNVRGNREGPRGGGMHF